MRKLGFGAGILVGLAFAACGSKTAVVAMQDMAHELADLAGVTDLGGDGPVIAVDGSADSAVVDMLLAGLDMSKAHAGTILTIPCDTTTVVTAGNGSVTTQYFALFNAGTPTGTTPVVVLSNPTASSFQQYGAYCTPGTTCTGYAQPQKTHLQIAGAEYVGSQLVVQCGYRVNPAASSDDQYNYYQTATAYLP